jgi:hypothetical protein
MFDLALWMIGIGLSLFALTLCWPFVKLADARGSEGDPFLDGCTCSEHVREAMTPDEVPLPGHDGIEEVHLDSLWPRRN